jgi:hypothetical protein
VEGTRPLTLTRQISTQSHSEDPRQIVARSLASHSCKHECTSNISLQSPKKAAVTYRHTYTAVNKKSYLFRPFCYKMYLVRNTRTALFMLKIHKLRRFPYWDISAAQLRATGPVRIVTLSTIRTGILNRENITWKTQMDLKEVRPGAWTEMTCLRRGTGGGLS